MLHHYASMVVATEDPNSSQKSIVRIISL